MVNEDKALMFMKPGVIGSFAVVEGARAVSLGVEICSRPGFTD